MGILIIIWIRVFSKVINFPVSQAENSFRLELFKHTHFMKIFFLI